MKIIDRYIAKTLLKYSAVVLTILVGVFAFFKFLEEVDQIGQASYTMVDALAYIALLIPSITYSLSSLILLLGVVLGLGHLASNSELIIMRGSGSSIMDITKTTLKSALAFMLVFMLFGELLAPISSEFAKQHRAQALSQQHVGTNQQGFWLKDSGHFVRVGKNLNGEVFEDFMLIDLQDSTQLNTVIVGDRATFDGAQVRLENPDKYTLKHQQASVIIDKAQLESYQTPVAFDQDLVSALKKRPQELSLWALFKQTLFLSENNLASDAYEMELYARLVKPLTLVAMVILSIPFVFGSLRDSSLGKKIFFGVVLGLGLHLVSKISSMISLRFQLDHLVSATLPTLLVLVLALALLYRATLRS